MNLSISEELELFSKELQRYMSPDALEQLGVSPHYYQANILKCPQNENFLRFGELPIS